MWTMRKDEDGTWSLYLDGRLVCTGLDEATADRAVVVGNGVKVEVAK